MARICVAQLFPAFWAALANVVGAVSPSSLFTGAWPGNFASFAFFAVKTHRKTRKTQKRNAGTTFQMGIPPFHGWSCAAPVCGLWSTLPV
jgi:hypothetical protein